MISEVQGRSYVWSFVKNIQQSLRRKEKEIKLLLLEAQLRRLCGLWHDSDTAESCRMPSHGGVEVCTCIVPLPILWFVFWQLQDPYLLQGHNSFQADNE